MRVLTESNANETTKSHRPASRSSLYGVVDALEAGFTRPARLRIDARRRPSRLRVLNRRSNRPSVVQVFSREHSGGGEADREFILRESRGLSELRDKP
jgi:hypothetical protein